MKDEIKTNAFTSSLIPHPSSLKASLIPYIVWAITATLTLLFVSLIVIAPIALSHGYNSSAFVLYEMFSHVCHQIPGRSFYIEGHPFAVCARCAGIYFGFTAGVLFYPLARSLGRGNASAPPARKWLLIALAPTLLDFTLRIFHLWENTHLSRLLTGALLGAVTAFYVVPGLMDLSRMSFQRSSAQESRAEFSRSLVVIERETLSG
jgi:uncharacterized membrane protein